MIDNDAPYTYEDRSLFACMQCTFSYLIAVLYSSNMWLAVPFPLFHLFSSVKCGIKQSRMEYSLMCLLANQTGNIWPSNQWCQLFLCSYHSSHNPSHSLPPFFSSSLSLSLPSLAMLTHEDNSISDTSCLSCGIKCAPRWTYFKSDASPASTLLYCCSNIIEISYDVKQLSLSYKPMLVIQSVTNTEPISLCILLLYFIIVRFLSVLFVLHSSVLFFITLFCS